MKYSKLLVCGIVWVALLYGSPIAVKAQLSELDKEVVEAIQKSDVSALSIWIAKGGDINLPTKSQNTLLMLAAKIGDRPIVEYLLSELPDPDVQNKAGATALMIASKYGHAHVVDMLLEAGADPTLSNNNGHVASTFALAYKHYEIYEKLKKAEAEFERQS